MPSTRVKVGDWLASFSHVCAFLRLAYHAAPGLLASIVVVRLVRAGLPIAILWIPKQIIDAVIYHRSHPLTSSRQIWKLLIAEIAVVVLSDVIARLCSYLESIAGDRLTNDTSTLLMRKAKALDIEIIETPKYHDMLERARNRSSARMALLAAILSTIQDCITLVSLSATLIAFSPWLIAVLILAAIPAFAGEAGISSFAYSALYQITPQRRQLEYLRSLLTSLHSAKEVRIFSLGEHFITAFTKLAKAIEEANIRVAFTRFRFSLILAVFSTGCYYLAYIYVLKSAIDGVISVGSLAYTAGAFARCRQSIERLAGTLASFSEEALYLNDLFSFLSLPEPAKNNQRWRPVPSPITEIEFVNVSFTYPGAAAPAVSNISFRISTGERLAIVGKNGAGKSTLVKLLLGLYRPTTGRILIDGIDLNEYMEQEWHANTAVIFQDFVRYEDTIFQNVRYGDIDSEVSEIRFWRACHLSNADGLVKKFPSGAAQMLGRLFEGGVGLSGGEWQKLALARANIKAAQLLILDEPTAHLDPESERKAFEGLLSCSRNLMAVIISHRISTIRVADRILVLENGTVVEDGTGVELESRDSSAYVRLFSRQQAYVAHPKSSV